ncbi:Alpha/Beta hydrolase protein [Astrocystis sublimbata]|nr:Alpha/Beta hydrolase protein [Astrocystis sublimbata]
MGSLPPSSRHEDFECKTLDGTTIRGWFFPVAGLAPAIIMSHGFNCVKEMTLPDVAEFYQSRGFNTILYDARSVGASDGLPRNELNPLQMAEDLSDIITHVGALPSVDSRRILLWGMSFGGMVSGCTAAVDSRPRGIVMVCPLFSFVRPDRRKTAFAQCIKDRVSQLRGNEAFSLQPFTPKGDNPAGFGGAGGPGGREAYNLMQAAAQSGHPDFRNRITVQTYHKMALARPKEITEMIDGVPVMMIVPELDDISPPVEQREVFDSLKTPKRMFWAESAGHLSIMTGQGCVDIMNATAQFFRDALEGKVEIAEE